MANEIKKIKVGSVEYDVRDTRLDGTVGSATKGIYLNNGIPTEMTYAVNKTVPSDAKFTDTVTTANTTGDGNAVTAITASNGALTVTKGTSFATQASLTSEASTRSSADSALSTRIDNLEARGRFLSTWDASTGKPGDLPSTIAQTAYVYKTGDYYVVKTAGNKNPSVPSGNTIPAGTTLENWTYSVTGSGLVINDTVYFTGSAWQILHTPVTQTTWGTIGGTLSQQEDLQAALDDKVDKGTVTSATDLTTAANGSHTHTVTIPKVTKTTSKLTLIPVTPAVANGTASYTTFGANTTASKASAGNPISVATVDTEKSIPNVTGNAAVTATYVASPALVSVGSASAGTAKTFTKVESPTIVSITPAVNSATKPTRTVFGTNTTASKATAGTAISVAKAGTAKSIPNVTGNSSVTATYIASPTVSAIGSASAGTAKTFTTVSSPTIVSITPATNLTSGKPTRTVLGTATTASKASAGTAKNVATTGTAIACDDITAWTTNTPTSVTMQVNGTTLELSTTAGTAAALSYTARSITPAVSNGSITPYTFSDVSVPVISSNADVTVAVAGTAITGVVKSNATTPTASNDTIPNISVTSITGVVRSTATTPSATNVTATNTTLGTAISVTPAESNGTITPYTFADVTVPVVSSNTDVTVAYAGTTVTGVVKSNATTPDASNDTIPNISITTVGNLVKSSATTPSATNVTASSVTLGTAIKVIPAKANGTITPYTFSDVTVPVVAGNTLVQVAKAGGTVNVADGSVSDSGTGSNVVTAVTVTTETSGASSSAGSHSHTITAHTHSVG